MKATEILKNIKTFLGEETLEEVKVELAQAKLENGTIVESESFKAGDEIFIITDDEKVAMPVGEYVMEDGKLLVVEEEGIIADYRVVSDDVPQKEDELEEKEEMDEEAISPKGVNAAGEVEFIKQADQSKSHTQLVEDANLRVSGDSSSQSGLQGAAMGKNL